MQLWDRGYLGAGGPTSPQQALAKGDLKFTLDGERLHGSWVLVRMKQRPHRRQAQQLAADQASRRARGRRRRRCGAGRGPVGRLRPHHGGDRRRARAAARSPSCWAAEDGARRMRSGTHAAKPESGERPRRCAPRRRKAKAADRRCRTSSRRSCASRSTGRPAARAGRMRSSSTAIACSCGSQDGKATLKTRKGLDWTAKFQAIADAAQGLARRHHRRRGRWRWTSNGAPGFRGAAGGAVGGQDRRPDLLRLRPAVRGRPRSARPAAVAAQGAAARAAGGAGRDATSTIRYVEHFETAATRCCAPPAS